MRYPGQHFVGPPCVPPRRRHLCQPLPRRHSSESCPLRKQLWCCGAAWACCRKRFRSMGTCMLHVGGTCEDGRGGLVKLMQPVATHLAEVFSGRSPGSELRVFEHTPFRVCKMLDSPFDQDGS